MGDPKGFIKYGRKEQSYRPVQERLKDYREVVELPDPDQVREQAARCMDCGIPFCHALGCPLGNLIPEWNDLVYRGNWKEALERLTWLNALPEITGRVCPALCEASCTLSINSSPVTIRQIELAVIEKGFDNGWMKPGSTPAETGKKVAVIGSGPAGLAAAWRLRQNGHSVSVFEKENKPGGVLRYGIPDFKLEKWVLDRRIKLMEELGVEFKLGIDIGKEVPAKKIAKEYDALLIAAGAGEPRDLKVPGRELAGIHFAMDYLTRSNKKVSGEKNAKGIITARGRNVLVIGGGDTGSDCVGTANRQGAKNIYQYEIMPKPREWKESWNPQWPDWPLILRNSSSHKEGAERKWGVSTKYFSGRDSKVSRAHFVEVEWIEDAGGKYSMKEKAGSEFELDVELVLMAMGFVHVEHAGLIKDLELELDERGNIKVDEDYMTSAEGVFSAGDSHTGASLVVRAIDHGQSAARSIDDFLNKNG